LNAQPGDEKREKRKEPFKAKTASLTFLVEGVGPAEVKSENKSEEVTPLMSQAVANEDESRANQYTRDYNSRRANNQKRKSALRRNLILADGANADNQSQVC
jgi:hypothetical protein